MVGQTLSLSIGLFTTTPMGNKKGNERLSGTCVCTEFARTPIEPVLTEGLARVRRDHDDRGVEQWRGLQELRDVVNLTGSPWGKANLDLRRGWSR